MHHRSGGSDNYYYQYKFISPEPLIARVKEEMRSFFSTGEIDDLMFPIYIRDVLRKLGQGSYKIDHTLLFIDCYQATLPANFNGVREAWATWDMLSSPIRIPGAYYQQITTVLNKPYDACNPVLNCDPCNPEVMSVVTKTNTYIQQQCKLKYLLTPGDTNTQNLCGRSLNIHYNHTDKFSIDGNKFTTEFSEGDVYLMYYSMNEDCDGNQLIPENFRIEQYIIDYIKCKMFEFLYNTSTADTYNQALQRYQMYEQKANESFVIAYTETKKQTMYQKAYGIYRDTHRNDVYERIMHGSYYNRFPHRRRGF